MTTFASFLRGINVGGNHLVKMSDLRDLYVALGYGQVTTYIQSGNVLFTSDVAEPAVHQTRIGEAFAAQFGFDAPIIVRTAAELRALVARNPYVGQPERAAQWIVAIFLAEPPTATAQVDLQAAYTGPEEFLVSGNEVLLYYPAGMGKSKLTHALIEKIMQTRGTARNWNTVQRMLELAAALDAPPAS